jgi:UDP-glucose-4-epimerase GalE
MGGAVLVTGGSGYIGSQTVHALRDLGHRVVVVDRRPPREPPPVGVHFVLADIAEQAVLQRSMRELGVESVIHLAGDKSVGDSMRSPGRYFENNVGGTLALLESMVSCGVRRIVFSSSCAVYGTPSSLPVGEGSPIEPQNPYAETKAAVERMLIWFDRCHDVRSLSLRYFNAAGADPAGRTGEELGDATNLIPVVMKAALGLIPSVEIFGTDYPTADGTAVRDYVHVADLAAAHASALDYLFLGGQTDVVNIGTGHGTSVREILRLVESISHRGLAVRGGPRREGDAAEVYAENRKALDMLTWHPHFGAREIIETAWKWHASGGGLPGAGASPEVTASPTPQVTDASSG